MEPNVIAALAKVEAEIGGIDKTRGKEGSLAYAYRGIDAIASQAQPLFGREGVVIVPTEGTIVTVDDIQVNGNPWTDTTVNVLWTIYGPNATEIEARTQGVGRDNSDKGYNKAMTQAFKNLLLRVLCIGDPKDDADQPDQQNNATESRTVRPDSPAYLAAVEQFQRANTMTVAQIAALKEIRAKSTNPDRPFTVPELKSDPGWVLAVKAMIDLAVLQAPDTSLVTDAADL